MDIEEGRRFIDLVEHAGIPVLAALWQKDELLGRWDFVLVTPLADQLGVKEAYSRLDRVLENADPRPGISLLDVSVMYSSSAFYKSLRREFRGQRDVPLAKSRVGDHIVDEGYLYLVK